MINRARGLYALAITNKTIVLLDSLLIAGFVWLAIDSLPSRAAVVFVLVGFTTRLVLWRSVLKPPAPLPTRDLASMMKRSDSQRRLAIRDDASGLYQRWYLELRLEEEAARCKRFGYEMAIVAVRAGLIDLSDWSFDLWRQKAAEVARSTASVVRNVDLCASLGPLEFAICLVHCDRTGADLAVERIVAELSGYTCAIGVAVYPGDQFDASALIELARGRSAVHTTPTTPTQAA